MVSTLVMDALIVVSFRCDKWASREAKTVATVIARLESKSFMFEMREESECQNTGVNDG